MVNVVFDIGHSRLQHAKFALGFIRVQNADFGGCVALERHQQVLLAARFRKFDAQALVGLLVDQDVGRRIRSQCVAVQPIGSLSAVQRRVEQRAVVVAPGSRCRGVEESLGQQCARLQILHVQREDIRTRGIGGIRQQRVVRAYFVSADVEKLVAFGERVDVQQDFFGTRTARGLAAVNRILLALFRAGIVFVLI